MANQHELKDDFRASGVLDQIATLIASGADDLQSALAASQAKTAHIKSTLYKLALHLKILERVTFVNDANATYLVTSCAQVVTALVSVLDSCHDLANASAQQLESSDDITGCSPSDLMLVSARVLVNLTNEQPAGCALVAGVASGCTSSALRPIMRFAALALCAGQHESLVVGLGLLVNLVEQNERCSEQLEGLELIRSVQSNTVVSFGTRKMNVLHTPARALDFLCDLYICASPENGTVLPSMALQIHSWNSNTKKMRRLRLHELLLPILLFSWGLFAFGSSACRQWLHKRLGDKNSPQLISLIDCIRSFGVVHAEAGILREGQAREFDEIIACLQVDN